MLKQQSNNNSIINNFIEYGKRERWWKSGIAFKYLCRNQLFKDIDINGKIVLDIGAGKGLYSLWAAVCGAREVVAMEPSAAGSRDPCSNKELLKAVEYLKLKNVEILPIRFQDYISNEKKFDLILLKSSVNHLSKKACIELQDSIDAQNEYISIFRKINNLLLPNGVVIITDCSSRNFFNDIKTKNPLAPTIEWQKHQPPEIWSNMLNSAGFKDIRISWMAPPYLHYLGVIFSNRPFAYFATSLFRIEARIQHNY